MTRSPWASDGTEQTKTDNQPSTHTRTHAHTPHTDKARRPRPRVTNHHNAGPLQQPAQSRHRARQLPTAAVVGCRHWAYRVSSGRLDAIAFVPEPSSNHYHHDAPEPSLARALVLQELLSDGRWRSRSRRHAHPITQGLDQLAPIQRCCFCRRRRAPNHPHHRHEAGFHSSHAEPSGLCADDAVAAAPLLV